MAPIHAFACLVLLGVASAQTTHTWQNRTPATQPKGDYRMGICYDRVAKRTLINGPLNSGDTWAWDGKTWIRLSTSGPGFGFRRMVYDTKRKRAVLVTSGGSTYEWDGKTWTKNQNAFTPVLEGYDLAYDSRRGVTVLFGGVSNARTIANTYEYDGKAWKQISSGGPPHRRNHVMAYDASRGEVVLFTGMGIQNSNDAYYKDTWVWNGIYWREHFGIANPDHRRWASFCYDPKRKVCILYGGFREYQPSKTFHDTWEWDGAKWTEVKTNGQPFLGHTTQMAFDVDRGAAVLVGLNRSTGQTWEYRASGGIPARFATFGTGCKGSAGIPTMAPAVGNLPRIGSTFLLDFAQLPKSPLARVMGIAGVSKTKWGGLNLPFDLSVIGMPGCTLYAAPELPLVSLPILNGAARWSIPIPNDWRLVGGPFYVQGMVMEPGVNAFGAVMTNAGEGRIGY